MTRFAGSIGIRQDPVESSPGIYTEDILEVEVVGFLRREAARMRDVDRTQQTITANHILSIYAPEEAISKFSKAVYVTWQGERWTVTSVEYMHPRFNLKLGGRYHGG